MSHVLATWLMKENPDQPLPTWRILNDALNFESTAVERIPTDERLDITHTGIM